MGTAPCSTPFTLSKSKCSIIFSDSTNPKLQNLQLIIMTDALIGVVLTQLATVLDQQIRQQVKLVTGVDREIQTLKSKLKSIQAVLTNAEKRHINEDSVKVWLDDLKNASYDIDDVLTDWATAVLQLQIDRSGDGAENAGKKKVTSFYFYLPCFCFSEVKLRRDIAIRIRKMTEDLNVIATNKDSYKFDMRASVEMEVTGRKHVENLVLRVLFQEVEKDKDTDNIVRFKMHDIVHDFAQLLTKNECSIMEADRGTARRADTTIAPVRHLTIIRGEDVPFPASVGNSKKLHSFWVQSFFDCLPIVSVFDRAPPDLFCRLKYVKTLDLSRNRLCELPMEVRKLMNLRYLNLSHNLLLELPETVCDQCNLQTLKLVACDHLKRLPQGIGKLISLRHLEIDRTESLKVLPTGIKRLSSLRTLSKFVIGSGVDAGAAACNIGDLKELNHLRGCLIIEGLGNVADSCEAEKAELKNKEHLSDLRLSFNPLAKADGTTEVVKALQLHPNLQFFQMKSYGGTLFPAWMISLTNLKKLRLLECQGCTSLPPLGKLPSLETLYIEHMQDLKCVTGEFLGMA
ncbi:hypothetical protein RJ639_005805 [Escallonia herrerae]|uniref:Rx N-terminal domain-containing protein n=1 Tax=Escallonia herrerae TaxID=1293975 RepID=A0AA89AT34_9ASTE|nr:hypothetical protein RJ639_005805 [Escallonia herrerae]